MIVEQRLEGERVRGFGLKDEAELDAAVLDHLQNLLMYDVEYRDFDIGKACRDIPGKCCGSTFPANDGIAAMATWPRCEVNR